MALVRDALRVRNIRDAEWEAYEEAEARERQAKEAIARDLGFGYAPGRDPIPARQCPSCAALVSLSSVRQHHDWHARLAGS